MNRTELEQLVEKSEALKAELESILRSSDLGVELQGSIKELSSALETFRFDSAKLNESWVSLAQLQKLLAEAADDYESVVKPFIGYSRDASARAGVVTGVVSQAIALGDDAEVVSEAKFEYPVGRIADLALSEHETYVAGMNVDDGTIGHDVDSDQISELIAQTLPALVDLKQVVISADNARALEMTLLAEQVVNSGDLELAEQFQSQFCVSAKDIVYADVSPLKYALQAQDFLRQREFASRAASKIDSAFEKVICQNDGAAPSPGF